MRFNSSEFQEAVKSLTQKLLQVIDVAIAVKQCKNFMESADITKFEVQNLQRNCNVSLFIYTCDMCYVCFATHRSLLTKGNYYLNYVND